MNQGKVYLIGAGPGDPGLLTCRAKQLLADCDVVCYDKLVSAAILATIPAHVPLHQVGYRGYQGTHIDYGMHPDVMAFALKGMRVARLKAGDPCIFGRTTEECRDLKQNGIPYEIVPGITAALGAAAYSGFPLTSCGMASGVTFVSGHKNTKALSALSRLGPDCGTLVLYMGAKKLAEHLRSLVENGQSKHTPIAFISSATSADHGCITGTLETIADQVKQAGYQGPALVIIGEVVALADELDWRQQLPLAGVRILVCGQYEAVTLLRDAGAEVIVVASSPVQSLIDREALAHLSSLPELGFSDLPAFRTWWRAVQQHHWDIRKFSMPLGSENRDVRKALNAMGLCPQHLSDKAMTLTLSEEQAFRDKAHFYLAGRVVSQPQPYALPKVEWVLVDNLAVFRSIAQHHPEAVQQAQLVPLNEAVRTWALAHDYLTERDHMPDFVDAADCSGLGEKADVA
ncbi:Uroporphyrinogen-III C-methyltransferase [Vibrio aerogenes CECT 7868]|uniref:uroporphyrinogen-III C-methyltransferase n=1 Tax=Vibrio aerogenes CECT 7868 TaxID=1216006 RepID=A0A1M6ABS3_9VIBR|nr:uroporphyrinogen-III C-methyltransferase [Vibrio aerogenes]SHI33936.1 Uroporphyrinogen-III C-methyltransferase [Vibrio aerogenes CECT 7868]